MKKFMVIVLGLFAVMILSSFAFIPKQAKNYQSPQTKKKTKVAKNKAKAKKQLNQIQIDDDLTETLISQNEKIDENPYVQAKALTQPSRPTPNNKVVYFKKSAESGNLLVESNE